VRDLGINDAARSGGSGSVAMMWLAIGTTRRFSAGVMSPV
jgi:hypothetical protein